LMMARPLAVFMRTRKPCVFLRWVVDGWKVRFMAVVLEDAANAEKPEIIADSASRIHAPVFWAPFAAVDNRARSK